MTYGETVASQCRYGEIAKRLFGDADVIFERAEEGYQGDADVFARLTDGRFANYAWSYGSCSGCDEWEHRGLSDDEIETEMRGGWVTFDTLEAFLAYCLPRADKELTEALERFAAAHQEAV